MSAGASPVRAYDFLLKFLLVGDSDVGKGEILASLQDGTAESPYGHPAGIDYKTTTILLDGRRVNLQLWDTSGQGRFCTIFRSYSRGAQGVVLVYDIANRWAFDGLGRWITEHAPGVPKILVGNRLHLAFKRQVPTEQAQAYAERLGVTFFEVSPLCNFNITESFTELARTVLLRHGMDRLWRPSKVLSLQDLCCRAVVSCTPVHLVDRLPLPVALRGHLKSFSMASGLNARMMHGRSYSLTTCSGCKRTSLRKAKAGRPPQSPPQTPQQKRLQSLLRRMRAGCGASRGVGQRGTGGCRREGDRVLRAMRRGRHDQDGAHLAILRGPSPASCFGPGFRERRS